MRSPQQHSRSSVPTKIRLLLWWSETVALHTRSVQIANRSELLIDSLNLYFGSRVEFTRCTDASRFRTRAN